MEMTGPIASSVRIRLTLGVVVMLLPLVVLAGGSYVTSRIMLQSLEQVISTETDELLPVVELQKLVWQAAMPPNDYIILGVRAERDLFGQLARMVDEKFMAMHLSGAFGEQMEKAQLTAAHEEWRRAKAAGEKIFAIPNPVGSVRAGILMKSYDAHIMTVADSLDRLYDMVRGETEEHRSAARAVVDKETLFLVLVSCAAIGIAALAAFLLTRSIVIPLRELKNGIDRFGQGDHSFRVPVGRTDEFGQLARTLNTMAERLEYDPLTGVYNRRELQRKLRSEIDRSLRHKHVFALLMLDIDHFKRVNDTYGHPGGDDVLRSTATVLTRELRSSDMLARYGGEEFAVLLPETEVSLAESVAERVRAAVAGNSVTTRRGEVLQITISIGVAAFPDDSTSEEGLVAAADRSLYAAKSGGRNRVNRSVRS